MAPVIKAKNIEKALNPKQINAIAFSISNRTLRFNKHKALVAVNIYPDMYSIAKIFLSIPKCNNEDSYTKNLTGCMGK